jgi:hypothetical protein
VLEARLISLYLTALYQPPPPPPPPPPPEEPPPPEPDEDPGDEDADDTALENELPKDDVKSEAEAAAKPAPTHHEGE